LLKSKIKTDLDLHKTFPPVGENLLFEGLRAKINPNYRENEIVSTRKAYGNALVKARQSCDRVIALDTDTKNSTFSMLL
jgi:hypothetical protein